MEATHPGTVLSQAFELINERGGDYDNVAALDQNYREIAAVAATILGKDLTARDIAMIMLTAKLIRAKSSPAKLDNYVDAANYLAFAASFVGLVPIPPLGGPPAPMSAKGPAPAPDHTKEIARLREAGELIE